MRIQSLLKTMVATAAFVAASQFAQAFEAKKFDDAAFKAAQADGGERSRTSQRSPFSMSISIRKPMC